MTCGCVCHIPGHRVAECDDGECCPCTGMPVVVDRTLGFDDPDARVTPAVPIIHEHVAKARGTGR